MESFDLLFSFIEMFPTYLLKIPVLKEFNFNEYAINYVKQKSTLTI